MNPNVGRQFAEWSPKSGLSRQEPNYPTRGYTVKTPDRVTAQQKLMGAGRGYDVHADMTRKGIAPGLN